MMVEIREITNDEKHLRIATLEERFEKNNMPLYKDNKNALKLAIAKCAIEYEDKK